MKLTKQQNPTKDNIHDSGDQGSETSSDPLAGVEPASPSLFSGPREQPRPLACPQSLALRSRWLASAALCPFHQCLAGFLPQDPVITRACEPLWALGWRASPDLWTRGGTRAKGVWPGAGFVTLCSDGPTLAGPIHTTSLCSHFWNSHLNDSQGGYGMLPHSASTNERAPQGAHWGLSFGPKPPASLPSIRLRPGRNGNSHYWLGNDKIFPISLILVPKDLLLQLQFIWLPNRSWGKQIMITSGHN